MEDKLFIYLLKSVLQLFIKKDHLVQYLINVISLNHKHYLELYLILHYDTYNLHNIKYLSNL